jgi:thioredoxin reductase/NAD-dependent dihydropyrimidine dehydrogenase PreA subunit
MLFVYGLPLLGVLLLYFRRREARERGARRALDAARASGLAEPVSLHPVINPNRCMGCGACATACPQGDVLGVITGQAELVNPTHCIGHGACREACPTDAITLAIGSETRGVDIPLLGPDFQSNVPGVFVAGELGGMGLIRNAIEQGRRAIESVRKLEGIGRGDRLDVVIVGAGPAGFGASLAALSHRLRFATLEQETLGGSIVHHPRGKIVVVHPVDIPLVGRVRIRETTKESLLAFWEDVRRRTGVAIREGERVEAVERAPGGFVVRTARGRYQTRSVVLAVGRRGTPRKLEVPGEELSKVVYKLVDAEQYRGKRVLVVGGGDSALEAAAALAAEPGTEVSLSYRGAAFKRASPRSRERLAAAERDGRVRVHLESNVAEIRPRSVVLRTGSRGRELANDAVIVCAGGLLPTDFLRSIGVAVETRYGTPLH